MNAMLNRADGTPNSVTSIKPVNTEPPHGQVVQTTPHFYLTPLLGFNYELGIFVQIGKFVSID